MKGEILNPTALLKKKRICNYSKVQNTKTIKLSTVKQPNLYSTQEPFSGGMLSFQIAHICMVRPCIDTMNIR